MSLNDTRKTPTTLRAVDNAVGSIFESDTPPARGRGNTKARAPAKKPAAKKAKPDKVAAKQKAKKAAARDPLDSVAPASSTEENPLDGYVAKLGKVTNKQITTWLEEAKDIDVERKKLARRRADLVEEAKEAGFTSADFNAMLASFKMDPVARAKRNAALQRGAKALKEQVTFEF